MEWIKKSVRLWTAEYEGRQFRLEKNQAANSTAGYVLKEMNSIHQPVRLERVKTMIQAKKLAKEWLPLPPATEPILEAGTRVKDLSLGIGLRR